MRNKEFKSRSRHDSVNYYIKLKDLDGRKAVLNNPYPVYTLPYIFWDISAKLIDWLLDVNVTFSALLSVSFCSAFIKDGVQVSGFESL